MQRKGFCKNVGLCNKANTHEIFTREENEDFVCPECGNRLKLLEEDVKSASNGKSRFVLIAVIAGVILLVAIILWLSIGGNSEDVQADKMAVDSTLTEKADSAKLSLNMDSIAQAKADSIVAARAITDSIAAKAIADSIKLAQADSILAASKKTSTARNTRNRGKVSKPVASSNSKNLGYAIYKGGLRNGQPDGVNATLTFKTRHVIDSRDPKGRVAEAGDYVIGEFSEGHLVQGIWYGSDNQVKGSVIIGK